MIRQAEVKDIAILAVLNKEVQDIHHKAFPGIFKSFDKNKTAEAFREIIRKRNYTFLLEFLGDEPRGYALFEIKKHKNTAFTGSYAAIYVHHIAVIKNHRSGGVGKSLLEAIKRKAKQLKIKRMELDVWSFNTKAKSFFQANGFVVYNEKMHLVL